MTEPVEITKNLIDVKSVFASKNPRLLKIIPPFVFSILKKILHQDRINGYIYKHRDKSGLPFVEAILGEFGVKLEVVDSHGSVISGNALQDIIPTEGRFILASNHPLGGLDGLALMHVAGKSRPDVVFPVNDLLMFIPGLKPLFIPINKHGKNTENVEIIHQNFASGKTILYFPAGLVSRKQKGGKILDLDWKKTFVTQAKKYQRDIIPVYISGRNTNFFYNLANLRKKVTRVNIEMMLLPDEMMRQYDKTVRLTFGEPIPFSTLDRSHSDAEWAQIIKEKVYRLGELSPA
ncbi:MAG: 1-acyl-sn-glycerol-3-phosphate acyltransferase [Bacteroidetes bacterium]|nr:1-acyl-sn-glycerol-3-phosphate acyltransferase [Bacteroidota bacterium]